MRWSRSAKVTLTSVIAVTLVFAWLAYQRRWISDDGLIYVRIVRNILEGNGPVFNELERAEANTSALWPWLLALVGGVTCGDLAQVAVWSGIACALACLVVGMDASRRWQRARGSDAPLVPGSVLIALAVFPFWDFASSGLETSFAMLWVVTSWWLLVDLGPHTPWRRQLVTACVLGLGPLVRPDLSLATLVFLPAAWLLVRPPRRRTLALAAAALALPVAYEVFRAGYYGALVPLPALAKSADEAAWGRGLLYLANFVEPHWLWLPMAVFLALFVYAVRKRSFVGRDRLVLAAPVIASVVSALYIMRVGGDFRHGRLWLPAATMLMAPAMLLPVRRLTVPALVVLYAWAVINGRGLTDNRKGAITTYTNDERKGYVRWTQTRNPTTADVFVTALGSVGPAIDEAARTGRGLMIVDGGATYALDPRLGSTIVYAAGRLGAGGAATPLDGIAYDMLGLANPIGARITKTNPGQAPGHQKWLPSPWPLAEFGDPARDHAQPDQTPAVTIRAARHALTCGDLKELLDSARAPLTVGRFFKNLVGAVGRTRLVIPADPIDAEWTFCDRATVTPRVSTSSAHPHNAWSKWNLLDGSDALGFSSQPGVAQDHEEWIELQLPAPRAISQVTVHPSSAGFPLSYRIQIWDGARWVDRATRDAPEPPPAPQAVTWSPADTTDRIRVVATHLRPGPDGYALQLSELELR